jgi:hypothetical protein
MDTAPVAFHTVTLGSTANFTVLYEDADRGQNLAYDAGALLVVQRRAQHVLDVCERDLSLLCAWFGIPVGEGLGPSNRVQVLLTTLSPAGTFLNGAFNEGYGSPPRIHANPFSNVAAAGEDESVAGLFVSELIEILMNYRGNWGPGDSNGEGLSRVAAYLLHPGIMTSAFADPAPTDIAIWMTDPPSDAADGWGGTPPSLPSHNAFRQDWVSSTFTGESGVPGDQDWFSFGCAILFIYYLKDQLGYTMPQIVQTRGATLEERFHGLTGRSGGFGDFRALLDAFYPAGVALPAMYDLFPLGDRYCRAELSASRVEDSPPTVERTGTAQRGTMCGPRQFAFTLLDLHGHLHAEARLFGFAHPIVSWTVNGYAIPAEGASGFTVSARVIPEDPTGSSSPSLEDVVLDATVGPVATYPAMTTFLDLSLHGNPGHVELRVDAIVLDAYATAEENFAAASAMPILDTQETAWDAEYRRASEECWGRYVKDHNRRLPWLERYMPDPAPDLIAAIAVLEEMGAELGQLAKDDPKLAAEAERNLGNIAQAATRLAQR